MESELSVREVLTKEYVGVSESDTVRDVVRIMRAERTGCALVVRGSEPVGIVTEWDVLGVVAADDDPAETTVGDVMSTPVLTIGPETSLTDAADTMARENIRNLVVEDGDGVRGICTQRDVIAAAGSFQAATARPHADQPGAAGAESPITGTESSMPDSETRMTATDTATSEPGTAAGDPEMVPNGGDEYSSQGVCESCGTLAESLQASNGQLLCSNCRSV